MKPHNENNFLIEVTQEVMSVINQYYMHSEVEPVTELYYSPYWKKNSPSEDKDNE